MNSKPCPDCDGGGVVTRREFLKTSITTAAAAAAAPLILTAGVEGAASAKNARSETLVTALYKDLSETQRKAVCFSFDHPLRSKVDNNWHITDKKISEFFTRDQQAMIKEIFLGLHSPEYAQTVYHQVEHDGGNAGGFGGTSIALFGEPGTGEFEFVITGRHCTRRCDGDSDEAMKLIQKNGFDHLHMAFYKNHDVGKDGVWDVWQIEGPAMVWYFRGDPHVHVWANIKAKA